jgi:hypothetical protein
MIKLTACCKIFETAFALQVFEVAADSAVFRELVELTLR